MDTILSDFEVVTENAPAIISEIEMVYNLLLQIAAVVGPAATISFRKVRNFFTANNAASVVASFDGSNIMTLAPQCLKDIELIIQAFGLTANQMLSSNVVSAKQQLTVA